MFPLETLIALGPLSFLLVLVHELGHATVALLGTNKPVLMSVGRQPPMLKGKVARLHFWLHLLPRSTHRTASSGSTACHASGSTG